MEEKKKKEIILLGATGSIGSSVLRFLREKREDYKLIGISAYNNVSLLKKIAEEFNVSYVALGNEELIRAIPADFRVFSGKKGLIELSAINCDIVVSGLSGIAGLLPGLTALRSSNNLAIANKEPLVVAGKFFLDEAKKNSVKILPLDSEHNSIFQCFDYGKKKNISHITLTASGGPFLNTSKRKFSKIKPEDAIKHPNWNMGKKISVDSSTMINKALEIIEAGILFNLKSNEIDVLVHPQSIVHGFVHYKDGSVLANLSRPDMISPVAVALSYPKRANLDLKPLDLASISKLTFLKPDLKKFPALKLGWESLEVGGAFPVILNASNEIAVESFLNKLITFNDIIDIINFCLSEINITGPGTVEDAIEIDKYTRVIANKYVKGL